MAHLAQGFRWLDASSGRRRGGGGGAHNLRSNSAQASSHCHHTRPSLLKTAHRCLHLATFARAGSGNPSSKMSRATDSRSRSPRREPSTAPSGPSVLANQQLAVRSPFNLPSSPPPRATSTTNRASSIPRNSNTRSLPEAQSPTASLNQGCAKTTLLAKQQNMNENTHGNRRGFTGAIAAVHPDGRLDIPTNLAFIRQIAQRSGVLAGGADPLRVPGSGTEPRARLFLQQRYPSVTLEEFERRTEVEGTRNARCIPPWTRSKMR